MKCLQRLQLIPPTVDAHVEHCFPECIGIPFALHTRATTSLVSASRSARVSSSNRCMKPSPALSMLLRARVRPMKGLLSLVVNGSEEVCFGRVPEPRVDLQHAHLYASCMIHHGQFELAMHVPCVPPLAEGGEVYGPQ